MVDHEKPRSSILTVIGDEPTDEPTDIHPSDFLNDRGAPARLGSEVQDNILPLPLREDTILNIDGLMHELRREGVEEALVLYYGKESGEPRWMHSGRMIRKDTLWLLQSMIHRLMKDQFGDED